MQCKNNYIIVFVQGYQTSKTKRFREMVLITLAHKQCDVIRTLSVSKVNKHRTVFGFLVRCKCG